MKKIFSILLLMSAGIHFTNAQSSVAIGDSNPKASAVLYLKGNGSQGLIIPIVANTSSIATPESGMIVYNSGDKKVYYHDGAAWTAVGSGSGGGSTYTLSLTGNNLLLKDASSTVSTVPIAASTPTAANQFLTWDGAKWVATTFTQDAANANGAITVSGIKGKVLPALPSTTQALVYNGTAWVFQALTGGTDSQDLTLNATTNSLSLTNDATPVDLTPYKQTLAIAGSSLSISGGNSVTIPGATYTGGTGITVAGTTITNTGDTNPADDITAASTAAGDVTGSFSNLQIASGAVGTTEIVDGAILATDLNAMSASNGQVLKFNGSVWLPSPDDVGGGATPTLSNGQILIGNGTTNSASALTGDATLTGGSLTILNNAITSAKIADGAILAADLNTMSAASGDVLKFNGTNWAPAPGTGTVYTGGTGISIAGTVITNTGDTNASDDLTTASTAAGDVTGPLSNLQIASGSVASTEIADGTIAGTDLATNLTIATTGNVTVNSPGIISGIGSGLTSINASNISSGSLAIARITPSATNGDVLTTVGGVSTWQAPAAGATTLDGLTDATVSAPSTGQILVNDGVGQFKNVSMSLDATMTSTGAVTLAAGSVSGGAGGKIVDASITSADLAAGSVSGGTGGIIADASITDADINATAAILGTKISPGFGSQAISTTGTATLGGGITAGGASQFTVNGTGNVTKINNVVTSFPAAQGAANTVLVNDGAGALTWATAPSPFSTSNIVPRGNGTTLVASTIQDNGTTTGIGVAPVAANKLTVSNSTAGVLQAILATNNQVGAGSSFAVKGDASGSTTTNFGLHGTATGGGTGASGVFGTATGSVSSQGIYGTVTGTGVTTAYGVRGSATSTSATNNYGVYGDASGGTNNWAGYFAGNVTVTGGLSVGATTSYGTSGQVLTSAGAGVAPTWTSISGSALATNNVIPKGNGTSQIASSLTDNGTTLSTTADFNLATGKVIKVNNATILSNVGTSNVFLGELVGGANTGSNNTFGGYVAGQFNTTGVDNTFYGTFAGNKNVSGSYDVFIGRGTGLNLTSGDLNTFVGWNAGFNSTTSAGTTSIGANAGKASTGGLGVFVGETTGMNSTTGAKNTFVGRGSGLTNIAGDNNTLLGADADVGGPGLSNATAIGRGASVNASNKVRIGSTIVTVIEGQVAFTAASDRRFKKDIKDIDEGLDFISKLRPVSYRMKEGDNRINWGFIAQDIESLVGTENAVLTIGGDSIRSLGLRYTDFVAPLVKSIQEQQAQIEDLKKVIQGLENKIKTYEANEGTELAVIRAEIKKLSEAMGMEANAEKKK